MVLLARRAAQLCTKRYASQPHDPRRLVSTNKSNTKQDPYTLSGAWSFLQRANPFTVWGETIGREPSDRLPKVTDLVKAVVGLSGKSPDELQRYATESNAAFEAYVDDLGFERRSLLEIAPKDEEQSLDEFLEGARDAVAFVSPLLKDAVAHENELSKVVSAQLLEKAKAGMSVAEDKEDEGYGAACYRPDCLFKHPPGHVAQAPACRDGWHCTRKDCGFTHPAGVRVRRVTFGVFGQQLRQKDLAPRSTGAMALFEQALQKWGYDAEARDDAILLRESTGLFVAKFSLADEFADLLRAAKETDAGRAVEALLYAVSRAEGRALTWPLPSDAHSRLAGDAEACALTMRGWLLVDVAVSKCLYTFAREVDRRSAYRWGHDWRIVDVGGAVFDNDDGALLDGLVAEDNTP